MMNSEIVKIALDLRHRVHILEVVLKMIEYDSAGYCVYCGGKGHEENCLLAEALKGSKG